MDLEEKVKELEKRIIALEEYISEKRVQQLTYPLDIASQTIIQDIV